MKPSHTEGTGPDGGNHAARILLAEDHLDSREALCALLEAFGFHVIPAVNGA
ncbi:MAG: hypothetical protein GWM90_24455, partial [Gemmatimonadetes bacterium]|nr:response regulator [Gemmatimonadota bacterium]NIQ57914.1 response regulator [Gemmatimonadota bacterium]NIU78083.1 hypothetical protein [Gammaproteobacteria bacterium]NIX39272.1 hypothetical protein [Gemmatimonadota bacterium]NIX47114.1 hypothetical protein [Gemmatimonadota bacterium]